MRFLIVLSLMVVLGCKTQKNNPDAKNLEDDKLILLTQDGYFPVDEPDIFLIEDTKTLNAFYAKVNRTRKPGLPVPIVDFANEIVLVACMGEQKTVAPVVLKKRSETDTEITFYATITPPESTMEASSHPFCVYKYTKTGKKVILEML